jgi:hypothetical protein
VLDLTMTGLLLFPLPNGLVLQLPGPGLRVHPKATERDAQTVPSLIEMPDGARSVCKHGLGSEFFTPPPVTDHAQPHTSVLGIVPALPEHKPPVSGTYRNSRAPRSCL